MREQIEDKVLSDLGIGSKPEAKPAERKHVFRIKGSNHVAPKKLMLDVPPETKYRSSHFNFEKSRLPDVDYTVVPVKSRTQYFQDWVESCGITWQQACSAVGTKEYDAMRDHFLAKKKELY